jgi:hypothetical protein
MIERAEMLADIVFQGGKTNYLRARKAVLSSK